MYISAVSFTSGRVPNSVINTANEEVSSVAKRKSVKFNRVSDILPVTVGLGVGLMVAYGLKTGKLDGVKNSVKNFMRIA